MARSLLASLALGAGLACTWPPGAEAAPARQLSPVEPAPAAPVVTVEAGRVTIAARDADLADVLAQLAAGAEFQLTTSGQLGRVTAEFSAPSVEDALRRLVQDHELMLVYSAAAPDRETASRLVQVDVFAQSQPIAATRGARAGVVGQGPAGIDEIGQLARMPSDPRNLARLIELARSAPEATVRGRAVSVLARVGAPAASALIGALGDQAAEVRVQAVYALRNVDRTQTIPAVGRILVNDPDVAVRRAAARMLRGLQDPTATMMLGAAAGDSDFVVRREVTRGLERQGASPAQ